MSSARFSSAALTTSSSSSFHVTLSLKLICNLRHPQNVRPKYFHKIKRLLGYPSIKGCDSLLEWPALAIFKSHFDGCIDYNILSAYSTQDQFNLLIQVLFNPVSPKYAIVMLGNTFSFSCLSTEETVQSSEVSLRRFNMLYVDKFQSALSSLIPANKIFWAFQNLFPLRYLYITIKAAFTHCSLQILAKGAVGSKGLGTNGQSLRARCWLCELFP